MNGTILGMRGVVVCAALLSATGCASAGPIGDIIGGVLSQGQGQGQGQRQGQQGEVYGEVQGVDTRQQYVQIRTQDGRTANVRFDQRTRVIYQQQEYAVTNLERGDVVNMRLQQDQQGNLYTDYIQVSQSVQDRNGTNNNTGSGSSTGQIQQFTGTVGQVDTQRGVFELRTQQGTLVVALPYRPSAQDDQRFRSLRAGQSVRVQGRMVANGRLELDRFY
ncbi:MAG TPA: hypothetical protein VE913_16040 [Longimicrobium sp.]|nr:hypothetical protein [Longimicrobium sp.]